jgi:hypothetical protein
MSTWSELAVELVKATTDADRRRIADEMHAAYLDEPSLLAGTTGGGLPYPSPVDPVAQGADAIRALAEAIDTKLLTHPQTLQYKFLPVSYTCTTAFANVPNALLTIDVKAGWTYIVKASLTVYNAGSGSSRNVSLRLTENGTALSSTVFASPFISASSANTDVVSSQRSAAADATLTYQVQASCTAASSCTITDFTGEIILIPPAAAQQPGDDIEALPTESLDEIAARLAVERGN